MISGHLLLFFFVCVCDRNSFLSLTFLTFQTALVCVCVCLLYSVAEGKAPHCNAVAAVIILQVLQKVDQVILISTFLIISYSYIRVINRYHTLQIKMSNQPLTFITLSCAK